MEPSPITAGDPMSTQGLAPGAERTSQPKRRSFLHIQPSDEPRRPADRNEVEDFATLYERHRVRLYWFCLRRTRDPVLAEDVVQDVFEAAFRARAGFDGRRPFWPWLAAIAARDCMDLQRRRQYAESRLPEVARTAAEAVATADLTASAVLQTVDRARLEADVRTLPDRQRVALQLFALDGWTYAQVAEHLGCTVAGVKGLIVRARERLREIRSSGLAAAGGALRWLQARFQKAASRLHAVVTLSEAGFGALQHWWAASASAVAVVIAAVAGLTAPVPSAGTTGPVPSLARIGAQPTTTTTTIGVSAAPAVPNIVDTEAPFATDDPGHSYSHAQEAERTANSALAPFLYQPSPSATPNSMFGAGVTVSPNYGDDPAIYVLGSDSTIGHAQPLLVSHDGGASWTRRSAVGLRAARRLALPPAFPKDPRIFALADGHLRVSHDDGETFQAFLSVPVGDFVLSPAFNDDDPTILFTSAGRLFSYSEDTQSVDAVRLAGLETQIVDTVTYAPTEHVTNPTIFVGTRSLMALETSLSRCSTHRTAPHVPRSGLPTVDFTCEPTELPRVTGSAVVPRLRSSPRLRPGLVLVIAPPFNDELYMSRDSGRSFRATYRAPKGPGHFVSIHDADAMPSVAGESVVIARTAGSYTFDGSHIESPLARTDDGGRTWKPIPVALDGFGASARAVAVTSTGRIIAVGDGDNGRGGGVACSLDDGRTWGRTCPEPDTAS